MVNKIEPDIVRLVKSIKTTPEGCWEWTKFIDKDGYGMVRVGSRTDGTRRNERVHRWAYSLIIGQIPKGYVLDHLCRNRRCCNPVHLEIVTPQENTKRNIRATATHCVNDHPLLGDNLYIAPDGKRGCKTCRHKRSLEFGRKTNWAAQRKHKERLRSD